MKKILGLVLFLVLLFITGCKDKPTDIKEVITPIENTTPKLVLTSDKVSGQQPLKVNFTGYFQGKIDTIKMLVPDVVMYYGTGKTVILYALPGETQEAKSIYTAEYTYGAGTYKAVMLLQSKFKYYYSDTLTITVN